VTYWLLYLATGAASIFTAPIGARLAHSLPVSQLKIIFALLLIAMGTKMLTGFL
jgi:uncharacterized membrane protein YfcA